MPEQIELKDLRVTLNRTMQFRVIRSFNPKGRPFGYDVVLTGIYAQSLTYMSFIKERMTRKREAVRIANAGNKLLRALFPDSVA